MKNVSFSKQIGQVLAEECLKVLAEASGQSHEQHPYHSLLSKHGFKHQVSSNLGTHEYTKGGHSITTVNHSEGKPWFYKKGGGGSIYAGGKQTGHKSGTSEKGLSSHLSKLT